MPVDLNAGSVPAKYRELFEVVTTHGLDRLTQTIFTSLFESPSLSKAILNQVWYAVTKSSTMSSRHEFYKCLALMALAQQGKPIDEKLLDNYVNRELPSPTVDPRSELEDRLVRLLRVDKNQTNLCYRYNDLCALDTVQVDLSPAKKGVIIRHFEYEISSMRHRNKVSRRYNDFVALDDLLSSKYPYRIIPPLPPKKSVNVDKEFIEERRRSLKNYLQILSRHPIICETDIIKFFLTFQGNGCADSMKATYKNLPDEFGAEPRASMSPTDMIERSAADDVQGIQLFRTSQTHLTFLHQQFQQIRTNLRKINERKANNAQDFTLIEQSLQTLSTDTSNIDRWATGPNDYWPAIQIGLASLPAEVNALSERLNGQVQRDNELINEHLDMLVDLLEGYKDLCRRFDEALQMEQKAMQKNANQARRSVPTTTAELASTKNEINLDVLIKRNRHALKCLQNETQLVYASLEGFVYILSNLGNSQHQGSSDLFNVWKSFATKVAQLGQNYISKSAGQRTNLLAGYRH